MPHAKKRRSGKTPPKAAASKLARKESQSHAIQKRPQALSVPERIETLLMQGDLTPLSVGERLQYYKTLCRSLGLNPLTRPFEYVVFTDKRTDEEPAPNAPAPQGKMVLYARADCAAQLRKIHGIGITAIERVREGEYMHVRVTLQDREGKTDMATGIVWLKKWKKGGNGQGSYVEMTGIDLANAMMKAETKAKRRGTLSIAGLGMLDASELGDITEVTHDVSPTGRVVEIKEAQPENPALTAYEKREQEGLQKLSQPQREIVERKIAEAKQKVSPDLQPANRTGAAVTGSGAGDAPTAPATYDGLLITTRKEGGYFIDGPEAIKKQARDLLIPFYLHDAKPAGIYVLDGPEKDNPAHKKLGKLMASLEKANVKFRMA